VPPIPVLVLFGPTASGKTEILSRFAARVEGKGPWRGLELVSADSMQIYRGMDIGTAKPSAEERRRIPHHLIDIRDPDEQFNAGEFVRLADECCPRIAGCGALPVVSGGTGFYLKNFILGLSPAPPSDRDIRGALREELRLRGAASLMEELSRVDPPSAGRIHLNDEYRLLRALEVFRLSGRPLSSFQPVFGGQPPSGGRSSPGGSSPGEEGDGGALSGEGRGEYRFLILGLRRERQELYRRIDERCARMFRSGLADEVKALVDRGYGPEDPGLRAIGYREFFIPAASGEGGDSPPFQLAADLGAVETLTARNSRRYAKRQICYFASIPRVRWIDLGTGEDPVEQIYALAVNSLTRP
jgi:tRNA dimethylallyltransferase